MKKGSITVFYHFYRPDDVVSAVHFAELCEGLAARGWTVTMMTSNRFHGKSKSISPAHEDLNGVIVNRLWRPPLDQSHKLLRLLNSMWMQVFWLRQVRKLPQQDFFLVSTDPQLSQFMLPILHWLRPNTKIIHWCFDLFPEAILADSNNRLVLFIARLVERLMPRCYRAVDIMVDIGACMRDLLRKHRHNAQEITLSPWALSEPDFEMPMNKTIRESMFGDNCKLGVLYSGTMGVAHDYQSFLDLARRLRDSAPQIVFAFSSRGNRMANLLDAISPTDTNIRILPFAKQEELADRLNAADIHLLSLRDRWAGIVVPSKFFGSIAAGKPVIYAGTPSSCIPTTIMQNNLGVVLHRDNLDETASWLIRHSLAPSELDELRMNAYKTYHREFSRTAIIEKWDRLLIDNIR